MSDTSSGGVVVVAVKKAPKRPLAVMGKHTAQQQARMQRQWADEKVTNWLQEAEEGNKTPEADGGLLALRPFKKQKVVAGGSPPPSPGAAEQLVAAAQSKLAILATEKPAVVTASVARDSAVAMGPDHDHRHASILEPDHRHHQTVPAARVVQNTAAAVGSHDLHHHDHHLLVGQSGRLPEQSNTERLVPFGRERAVPELARNASSNQTEPQRQPPCQPLPHHDEDHYRGDNGSTSRAAEHIGCHYMDRSRPYRNGEHEAEQEERRWRNIGRPHHHVERHGDHHHHQFYGGCCGPSHSHRDRCDYDRPCCRDGDHPKHSGGHFEEVCCWGRGHQRQSPYCVDWDEDRQPGLSRRWSHGRRRAGHWRQKGGAGPFQQQSSFSQAKWPDAPGECRAPRDALVRSRAPQDALEWSRAPQDASVRSNAPRDEPVPQQVVRTATGMVPVAVLNALTPQQQILLLEGRAGQALPGGRPGLFLPLTFGAHRDTERVNVLWGRWGLRSGSKDHYVLQRSRCH